MLTPLYWSTSALNKSAIFLPRPRWGLYTPLIHLSDYLKTIVDDLKESTGIQNWVGSLGMGIIASDHEYYDEPALAIMLADFNESEYRLLPNFTRNLDAFDNQLNDWCQQHDFHIGLVHGDPEKPGFPKSPR